MKILLFIFTLNFSFLVKASVEVPVSDKQAYVLCKNSKIVRTIRVDKKSNSEHVCKTTYTKLGVDRVIGESTSIKGCYNFLNNVKSNLESANWKCRDISGTPISFKSVEKK